MRFFGNERESTVLRFEDIEWLLKSDLEVKANPIKKEFKTLFEKMAQLFKNLRNSLEKLRSASLEENLDSRTSLILNAKRRDFLAKMEGFLSKFELPERNNFECMLRFHNTLVEAWNEANLSLLNEYLQIKEYFKDETKEIFKSFKQIYSLLESFGKKISKNRNILHNTEVSLETLNDFKLLLKEFRSRDEEMKKMSEELEELEERLAKLKQSLERLISSDSYAILKSLMRRKRELEYKQMELASSVVETLASLERPMKKAYFLMDGCKKEIKEYLLSPFDALLRDTEQRKITKILVNLKKLIEGRKIQVKSEKVVERIDQILKNGVLNHIAETYTNFSLEIKEIKRRLSATELLKKKTELESEIEVMKGKLKQKEAELNKLEEKLNEIKDLISRVKNELEAKVSEALGKQVKIIYPM